MNNLYNFLNERGYIYQTTHPEKIEAILNSKTPITFYLGIDPTADSLHIGHFFGLMMFRHLQEAGHKGILIVGGATALVGDPTGKCDMRKMMTKEQVQHNVDEVIALAKHFIKTDGDNPAIILNNADWMKDTYIDFMRKVGIHFNVNKMLASEAYAKRLEQGGLTLLEMGYMLMQAYDFIYLNEKYNCTLEIGGSDQWGNIVAGTELFRKMNNAKEKEKEDIVGLTCPLLMTKEGKKMGKTENGTLWVARDRTTPFSFYQYFYNVDDSEVATLLNLFTLIPTSEIKELCATNIIAAKRRMAFEITALVHGVEEAEKAKESAKALFGIGQGNLESMPQYQFDFEKLKAGILAVDLLTQSQFIASKSEARRLIQGGGIMIDNQKIEDINAIIKYDTLPEYILLQKGKKSFLKLIP